MGNKIEALVDVDQVRRQFYGDYAVDDKYWWWIRGVKYDTDAGLQLIVDSDDGDLYRIPAKVTGNDVSFGDVIQVTEEFPDKEVAATAVIAGMRMFDGDMLVYATRADTDTRPETINPKGATMDEATRSALASRLGLPEDASEEQINEAIDSGQAAVAASAAPEGDPPAPPAPPEGEPAPEGEPTPEGEPAPEGEPVEAGVVQLDRAAYEQLKAGSDLAVKHEQGRRQEAIKATVGAAVEAGKIPPARRQHWETALAADFDGNKAVLDSLEGGLVPVSMRGNAGNADDGSAASNGEGLPESWFPEIAASKTLAASGSRVTNAREG